MITQAPSPMSLASVLGLRPLDRLQVSNSLTIREFRNEAHFGGGLAPESDLPFWYFRRVVGDQLEVSSPGGYVCRVAPSEVCVILPGTVVPVMAMTKSQFLAWGNLSSSAKNTISDDKKASFYSAAYVIGAQQGRFGFCFEVEFVDAALKHDRTTFSPLSDASRRFAESMAKRTIMPIASSRAVNFSSANKGVLAARDKAKRAVSLFFRASLNGNTTIKSTTLELGDRLLSTASLNRLSSALNRPPG